MPFRFFGGREKHPLFKIQVRSSKLRVDVPIQCMLRPARLHRLKTGGIFEHAIGKPGPEYEFDIEIAKNTSCNDKSNGSDCCAREASTRPL